MSLEDNGYEDDEPEDDPILAHFVLCPICGGEDDTCHHCREHRGFIRVPAPLTGVRREGNYNGVGDSPENSPSLPLDGSAPSSRTRSESQAIAIAQAWAEQDETELRRLLSWDMGRVKAHQVLQVLPKNSPLHRRLQELLFDAEAQWEGTLP